MGVFNSRKIKRNSPTYNRQNVSDQIYYTERTKYICAALSQFEWKDMDDTFNPIFFEQCLLFQSQAAALTKRGVDRIIGLPFVTRSGRRELYGGPWDIFGIARNTYNERIRAEKFEICYDTIMQQPGFFESAANTMQTIEMYAMLKWECLNTFRMNLMHQNTPFIIETSDKKKLSFANFWERFQDFNPYQIVEEDSGVTEAVKPLNTNVNYIGEQLLAAADVIDDMALFALGYPRGTTKQQRQIVSETIANTFTGGCQTLSRLVPRMDFIERYNRTFGRNASVTLRTSPILDMVSLYGGTNNVQSNKYDDVPGPEL